MDVNVTEEERHLVLTGLGLVSDQNRDPATGQPIDAEKADTLRGLEDKFQLPGEGRTTG